MGDRDPSTENLVKNGQKLVIKKLKDKLYFSFSKMAWMDTNVPKNEKPLGLGQAKAKSKKIGLRAMDFELADPEIQYFSLVFEF